MRLEFIKADGVIYKAQEPGEQAYGKIEGCFKDVCYIKKLRFRRWQIDDYDERVQYDVLGGYGNQSNQTPNARIILYPSGIEQIKYIKIKEK